MFLLVQLGIMFIFSFYESGHGRPPGVGTAAAGLGNNGLAFSLMTMGSAAACTLLTWWAVRLRPGIQPAAYLGLRRVPARTVLAWLAVTMALMIAFNLLEPLIAHPQAHHFTLSLYRSAVSAPLFWFAIAVAGPAFEEVFFRGFLLPGLRYSRLGAAGAVIFTALVWAVSHAQYSGPEVAEIFVFGLVLGTARLRTDSLYPPLAMHAFLNIAALLQAAFMVDGH